MKTLQIICGIVLMAIAGLMMNYSCNTLNEIKVAESVMIDQTDSNLLAIPDANAIKQKVSAGMNNWEGYEFRLLSISDVDYNPIYQKGIAPACEYLSNSYDRTDEVQKFFSGIDSSVEKIKSVRSGKIRSSIYTPMAKELNHLSESAAIKKVLIIYSDLMENSYLTNFYRKSVFRKLENSPEEIQKEFQSAVPLKNLHGIEVLIIYQAPNNEESRVFTIVSEFYKKLLEDKGARVNISANF